jgi:hypothetical protein
MEQETVDVALDDLAAGLMAVWDRWGWTQHHLGNENTGYCLMGAWGKATATLIGGYLQEDQLSRAFRNAVASSARKLFPDLRYASAEGFNDATGRSEEDVRLVAKHAIYSLAELISTD